MRKEVKLGMTIGGALVALLVTYLLVAPPANNKKGAQLAGGPASATDLVQPGDLTGPETAPMDAKPAAPAEKPTAAAAEQPKAQPKDASALKAGGDDWSTMLKTGKPVKPTAVVSSDTDKKDQPKAGEPEAREKTAATPAAEPRRETARASHRMSDPHAAWGGGVSSDAVFGSQTAPTRSQLLAGPSGDKPKPAASASERSHTVRSGETFSSIAAAAYGSAAYYPHLIRANPNVNPSALRPGMVINVPPLDEVKASAPAKSETHSSAATPADPKIDAGRQYKVQSGDSLYRIAIKLYGKSSYADKIYEKNKSAIGPDNRRLKLGMVLDLPETPEAAVANSGRKAESASAAPASDATSTLTDGAPSGIPTDNMGK